MLTITSAQLLANLRYTNATNPSVAEIARRRRYLTRYPAQEANILSYQENPSCRCSSEIYAAMASDPAGLNAVATIIMDEPTEVIVPRQMAGEIIEVNDTPEDWRALNVRIKNEALIFRALEVVVSNGKLRVFFY
jgi:hypothetical protein